MEFFDKAKALMNTQEVDGGTTNLLADCVETLRGNPVAVAKILWTVSKTVLSLPDMIFWEKFESFLGGDDFSEEDRLKFCAKLAEDGEKGDNPYRLIEAINRCDTKRKIRYLKCASRALVAGFIDLATYFRIAQTIANCLMEDLEFVAKNVLSAKEYEYSDTVQGLLNCGLMYQSVYDGNNGDKYIFTPFANVLDLFSLSFDNVDRYPNPKKTALSIAHNKTPIEINNPPKWG